MLKLQYTETGLFMEWMAIALEDLIAQRVILALRAGQGLYVQSGQASFLLPAHMDGLEQLTVALRRLQSTTMAITPVDDEFVEVSLQGSWIAERPEAEEGMFISALTERTELLVYKLWQKSQVQVSSLAS